MFTIGKIFTEKPIHKNSLQNALANILCNPKGFRIEEVKEKIFQFFFEEKKDVSRILNGSPWIFRNSWLVIKPWQRDTEPKDMEFTHVPVWEQLLGLPSHCRTKNMANKIGGCIGEVLDSRSFILHDKSIIMKVKVMLSLSQILKKGVNTGSKSDGVFWVDFRSEKLPQFCFRCGRIGHGEQGCQQEDTGSSSWGPWLRSLGGGRRISNDDGRSGSKKKGPKDLKPRHRRGFPHDLLSKLDAMSFFENSQTGAAHVNKDASEGVPSMQRKSDVSGKKVVETENKTSQQIETFIDVISVIPREGRVHCDMSSQKSLTLENPVVGTHAGSLKRNSPNKKKWKRLHNPSHEATSGDTMKIGGKRKEVVDAIEMEICSPKTLR